VKPQSFPDKRTKDDVVFLQKRFEVLLCRLLGMKACGVEVGALTGAPLSIRRGVIAFGFVDPLSG
jgi:hypothetical protein